MSSWLRPRSSSCMRRAPDSANSPVDVTRSPLRTSRVGSKKFGPNVSSLVIFIFPFLSAFEYLIVTVGANSSKNLVLRVSRKKDKCQFDWGETISGRNNAKAQVRPVMDKLQTLFDRIKKFYERVETHDGQIRALIKETKKPCNSILNQSIFLRAVTPEDSVDSTGLKDIPGYRVGLINEITCSLDRELVLLGEIRDRLKAANDELYSEQQAIDDLYCDLRDRSLIKSSQLNPCCPRLEFIIDSCADIWRYYQSFLLQLSHALTNLDYECEESVSGLAEFMKEDLELRKRVDKIRSFHFQSFEFMV